MGTKNNIKGETGRLALKKLKLFDTPALRAKKNPNPCGSGKPCGFLGLG
jgi:hypothetical protein